MEPQELYRDSTVPVDSLASLLWYYTINIISVKNNSQSVNGKSHFDQLATAFSSTPPYV